MALNKPRRRVTSDESFMDDGFLGGAAEPQPIAAPEPAAGKKKFKVDKNIDAPTTINTSKPKSGLETRRIHDYDTAHGMKRKKLTKAAQKSLAEWSGDMHMRKRDTYFQAQGALAKERFGHASVFNGNELNSLLVGIPMPSLALEWATENDVFPLSQVVIICGRWGTCKSALLYEIFRWFAAMGGGAIHHENETKFSEDLCTSIMGIDMHNPACPIIVNKCTSVEDWQERMTFFLKDQKKRLIGTKEAPGPGRTIPVCFSVDSVMGKSSVEKQEKIQAHGSAGRDGPVESLKISGYFQAMSHEFDNWPFSLVLVNHLKPKVTMGGEDDGGDSETSPGGKFVRFQESFELRTSVWKSKIDTSQFDGIGIRIHCAKNSFGVTGRKIKTRMLWWDEEIGQHPKTGQPLYQRRTKWDWDWSTITTLNELPDKMKARLKKADFHLAVKSPTADVECLAQSRTLGMGKDDWESFQVVGAMIRQNEDVKDLLRTALSIKRRALLRGDYLEQLDQLKQKLQ